MQTDFFDKSRACRFFLARVSVRGSPIQSRAPAVRCWVICLFASPKSLLTPAEVGDVRRFDNPRQLMYLSSTPGERSSGQTRRLTSITKAGSTVARRLIVGAAWSYRKPAKIGQAMQKRQQALPSPVRNIARSAEVLLSARYRRMLARRKKARVVITISRELVGFMWAIAREVDPKQLAS
jgi:hypothetical protein